MPALLTASVLHWLLKPDLGPLLVHHGATVVLAVVAGCLFAESGLLVGFFLPGDSLLFTAGLVSAQYGQPNIIVLLVCCFVAAAVGDQVGYIFGQRIGPALFTRPDSRLFKQENVARSHEFFERRGPKALVLARFVPIVRTFVPVLAGVSRMRYRTFVVFNVLGAAAWAAVASLLGYFLGRQFPHLKDYLTPVLVAIVAVSLLPVALEVRRDHRARAVP